MCVERMRQRGYAPEAVLSGSGIAPGSLQKPTKLITRAQELLVFSNCLALTQDGSIGLELGAAHNLPRYGLLGYTMMVSPTLGDALQVGCNSPVQLGSFFRMSVTVIDSKAHLIADNYHYRQDLEVFNTEMCLSSMWTVVCDLLGKRQLRPNWVSVRYAEPGHAIAYQARFGCPVQFDAPENALVFPVKWLDSALPYAEPTSFEIAHAHCAQIEHEWIQSSGNAIAARVLRLIHNDPARYRNFDQVAQAMFVTPRTLRRRLQASGVAFQNLLDSALYDKANYYLSKTNTPIAEVGGLLGYSEASSFRQAFKRWSGKNPSEVRRSK
jgi:AraC-like DNA-binding protein